MATTRTAKRERVAAAAVCGIRRVRRLEPARHKARRCAHTRLIRTNRGSASREQIWFVGFCEYSDVIGERERERMCYGYVVWVWRESPESHETRPKLCANQRTLSGELQMKPQNTNSSIDDALSIERRKREPIGRTCHSDFQTKLQIGLQNWWTPKEIARQQLQLLFKSLPLEVSLTAFRAHCHRAFNYHS